MDGQMPITLIATKLTAPTAPNTLVDRPRLAARLDAAADDHRCRLALVSAPAGSGKSTLVASWLLARPEATAWLQCETADADPARFWTYLVAGLAPSVPGLDEAMGPSLAGSADLEPVLARLVNHLSTWGEPATLVIDDYHAVANPTIDEGLERLIDRIPASITIVVCTRIDPGIRMSRLRVRHQVVEVRADDLRFAEDEAGPLLAGEGPALDDQQVASLCQRTEGWAAGLVLAGMSLASGSDPDGFVASFQGDDRLVVDYLTDEFLAGLAADDRIRLLRTSILDRLSGPLVDALCDDDGGEDGGQAWRSEESGAAWLRRLARSNQLLIRLDRTGTWFRYHHLLGDLLRLEATEAIHDELAGLHRRAGAWHQRSGSIDRAIDHLIEGGDPATAAGLIWDHATELLNRGQLQTVLDQIDRLGPLADEHAGSLIIRGWIAQLTGRFHEAERCLTEARTRGPRPDETGQIVALGIVNHLSQGDVAAALAVAEAADAPLEATQAGTLAIARVWAGRFEEAWPLFDQTRELARAEDHTFAGVAAMIYGAVAAIESGDRGRASALAAEALAFADANQFENLAHLGLAYSIAARTGSEDGGGDERAEAARKGVALARRSPALISLAYALTTAGDVLCELGTDDGPEAVTEARALIDRCPDPGIAGRYLDRVEARHGLMAAPRAMTGLIEELTDRELAVLRFLPSPLSQREIANELFVSLNTVKTHCRAIYRKLGTGDRKAAVQAARDLDLL